MPSRAPVLLALAAATLMAGAGARTALEYQVILRLVQGPAAWALFGWMLLGSLLGLIAIGREIAWIRRGEPRTSWFPALRSFFVVAVGTWIGFLALVESVERLWFDLALGLGASLWLAWIALEGPCPPAARGSRKSLGVLLFTLAACAPLLEIGLRVYAAVHPSPLLARVGDTAHVAVERMRQTPGRLRFGFPHNRGGHYDEEFHRRVPGERLVVTIGDSFSLSAVPHAYHFTTVCERELGLPVDNMGIAGVGPREYLRMLCDEALPLDPSLVVIDLFVGNDCMAPGQVPAGPRRTAESWLQRENVLLWVVSKRLTRLFTESRLRSKEGRRVAVVQGEEQSGKAAVGASFPWVVDPSLETPTLTEPAFLALETQRASEVCRYRPADMAGLHEILLEMKQIVGEGKLCVMIIPDEFQIEDALWKEVLANTGGQPLDRDRPQDLLVPWLAGNGIPCLDLTPILRAVPPMEDGRRHLYHVQDSHWNARGNAAAGEALAKFLAPRLTPADAREPATSPLIRR